jgi:hypothetical protein
MDGVAQFLGQQRPHSRNIRLPRQHLETEHQLDVRLDVMEFHCKWRDYRKSRSTGFMRAFCFGILEGVQHAHTFNRLLRDSIDALRLGELRRFKHGRNNIDDVPIRADRTIWLPRVFLSSKSLPG